MVLPVRMVEKGFRKEYKRGPSLKDHTGQIRKIGVFLKLKKLLWRLIIKFYLILRKKTCLKVLFLSLTIYHTSPVMERKENTHAV